jgi:hypothetical protein
MHASTPLYKRPVPYSGVVATSFARYPIRQPLQAPIFNLPQNNAIIFSQGCILLSYKAFAACSD